MSPENRYKIGKFFTGKGAVIVGSFLFVAPIVFTLLMLVVCSASGAVIPATIISSMFLGAILATSFGLMTSVIGERMMKKADMELRMMFNVPRTVLGRANNLNLFNRFAPPNSIPHGFRNFLSHEIPDIDAPDMGLVYTLALNYSSEASDDDSSSEASDIPNYPFGLKNDNFGLDAIQNVQFSTPSNTPPPEASSSTVQEPARLSTPPPQYYMVQKKSTQSIHL